MDARPARDSQRRQRYGFIQWLNVIALCGVWIGEPKLADEKKIPDLRWCSDLKWIFEGSTYHVQCN
jgi:hypothetical protein